MNKEQRKIPGDYKSAHLLGRFGGQYVPETLMAPLRELEEAYRLFSRDPGFRNRLKYLLSDYAGRPTPLYFAESSRNMPEERAST